MKKTILAIMFVTAIGSSTLLNSAIAENIAKPAVTITAEKTVTLAVPGMFCASCPFTVRKSLEKLDGIISVTTSGKTKTAIVTYDSTKLDVDALIKATTNVGYPSSIKKKG